MLRRLRTRKGRWITSGLGAYIGGSIMKTRTILLAAALALLVGAAPAAACLAAAHEAPAAERAPSDCEPTHHAASGALCPDSGRMIPATGLAAPTPVTVGYEGAPHPGAVLAPDRGAGPAHVPPRARSAPIHLLHATFLI